jgi:hypothetical protein
MLQLTMIEMILNIVIRASKSPDLVDDPIERSSLVGIGDKGVESPS